MKLTILKKTILLALLTPWLFPQNAFSDKITGVKMNYLEYTLDTSTNEAILTYQIHTYENVTIPNTITYENKTYTIVEIGDRAFYEIGRSNQLQTLTFNCKSLRKIGSEAFINTKYLKTVSGLNSTKLESLGDGAFSGCTALTSISFPTETFTTIGARAFYGCSALASITIPSSVTYIGDRAFFDCSALTSIRIPSGVTYIGSYAFYRCSNNSSTLSLPQSLETLGDYAFAECTNLKGSIEILESITYVPAGVFKNCQSLTGTLSIPSTITEIGGEAFYGCTGLTGPLTIPNSTTLIGARAFKGCTGLNGRLTIGNAVETIGDDAFYGCNGLTGSLTLPGSVTSVGSSAFYNCTGFTGLLNLNEGLQTIGGSAFYGCSKLIGTLDLPSSLNSIGASAFSGCTGFNGDIEIPGSVETIEDQVFYNCSGFDGELILPDGLKSINSSAFYGCKNLKGDIVVPNAVTTIGSQAFYNCSGFDGNLYIGNSTTEIAQSAFYGCSGLQSVTFGESVVSIGTSAFYGCSGLQSVTFGESVSSIGASAFYNCSGLKGALIIPNSVQTIDNNAFYGCSGFTSLILGEGLIELGNSSSPAAVFPGCSGLTSVTSLSIDPPTAYYSQNFDSSVYSKPLYVPAKAVILYKNAPDWKKFTSISAVPEDAQGFEFDFDKDGEVSGSVEGLTLKVGQTYQFSLKPVPAEALLPEITWTSDNDGIASITSDGLVEALSIGEANITASATINGNEVTATCRVIVIAENPITSLALNPEEVELALNALPFAFEAVFEPSDASVQTFTWTSSDTQVATVDDEGNVTPVGIGTALITATAQDGTGLWATSTVTVTAAIAEDFEFEFDEEVMGGVEGITLEVGQTYQFVLKPSPEDAALPEITWTSSDDDIAYVSPEGEVLAIEVGQAGITASATVNGQEVTATCTVTVVPITVKTLTLSAHELLIDSAEGEELYVSFTPAEAVPVFTWSVDDETVVDMQPGAEQTYVTLKPLKAGTATVTVEADGQSDQCEVTVTEAAGIGSIFAEGADADIEVYDLAGRKISNSTFLTPNSLKAGIYIIRKGEETHKVLVK